jgi:hypothetical protein
MWVGVGAGLGECRCGGVWEVEEELSVALDFGSLEVATTRAAYQPLSAHMGPRDLLGVVLK